MPIDIDSLPFKLPIRVEGEAAIYDAEGEFIGTAKHAKELAELINSFLVARREGMLETDFDS